MRRIVVLFAVLLVMAQVGNGQERVAVKPSAPRPMVGPPPLPLESDVLRYVFEHFPGVNKDEVMAFVGEHFKSDLPEFRKLASENATSGTVFMMDLVRDALALMEIAKKDKALADMMIRQKELERSAVRKAKEVALADDSEKEKRKEELRQRLAEAFDAKQELMQRDLSGMEAELKKLHEMITRRSEYRKQIIDKKLDEMTVEEDYLKW